MEKMNAETVLSFFRENHATSSIFSTMDKAKKSLYLFARVWQDMCQELQKHEEKKFSVDTWKHDGGTIMAIVHNGNVFSKASISISIVNGKIPMTGVQLVKEVANISKTFTEKDAFLGITLNAIIHAQNPHVPTVHFNLRHFIMNPKGAEVDWYGGAMDLNPCYLEGADAAEFHRTLKYACDKHNPSYYPRFKKWCDEYFFIPHHGETRGIGGIFFDGLKTGEENFRFLQTCGETALGAYLPILKRRRNTKIADGEMAWKNFRNSRYTEFNLMYNKAIKFGFELPNFPAEVLFCTLPPNAEWGYKSDPEIGSREHELVCVLRKPKAWV